MYTNTVVVGVLALVIGLGSGYLLAGMPQQGQTEHSMSTTMTGMTSALEDKAGADFESTFIDEMIVHHEGAVAMARLVLQRSERPELVQLANDIISAQTQEITLMRGWKDAWFRR